MPRLLGIRIENFKSLADVTIGQVGYGKGETLPALSCFIGPNGSGKSTLLDAFGFLADCLREGVEAACDKPHRGGFERLRTSGSTGPIRFELYYKEELQARPISFSFAVDLLNGVPVVIEESLRQRRKGQKHGQPFPFLRLDHGSGSVWSGHFTEDEEGAHKIEITLDDLSRLGITTLGQLKEHPRIVGLRSYIENWYLSYFVPDAARKLPPAGAQRHLDRTGENLANVVEYLDRSYKERFREVLKDIAAKIPGLKSIKVEKSPDGRLLLQFNESGYVDPFYQQAMSDGTLKMFAYLMLLQDPEPRPFIGIEEPENGLYHKLLLELARQFLAHAEDASRDTQLFVTTHSPYLVNALRPEQVWLLQKDEKGRTVAQCTASLKSIQKLVDEGIPLGSLWYSDHFGELPLAMRLHILVEGESEKRFLRIWLRRFLPSHPAEIHPHLGKGRLTPHSARGVDARREGLLDQLPAKLRAYGKTLDPSTERVLVLVDADREDCRQLKERLVQEIERCDPAPAALVRIAVEELESFYLGEPRAIQAAYPNAKLKKLNDYQPDSICGAAERFRDLIGAQRVDKVAWAEAMAQHLSVDGSGRANRSPSFRHFCRGLRRLVGEPER